VTPGGARRRGSPEQPKLELSASDFDGNNLKTKHRTSGTYLGTCRGGRRGGVGDRRRRLAATGGAPAAVWFERGRRRGEGCGVMRESCPTFIGRRKGRGGGVEAVARAQWPAAAMNGGGAGGAAVSGRGGGAVRRRADAH
jgi:hypothetical protein